jgi:hypothetical protein
MTKLVALISVLVALSSCAASANDVSEVIRRRREAKFSPLSLQEGVSLLRRACRDVKRVTELDPVTYRPSVGNSLECRSSGPTSLELVEFRNNQLELLTVRSDCRSLESCSRRANAWLASAGEAGEPPVKLRPDGEFFASTAVLDGSNEIGWVFASIYPFKGHWLLVFKAGPRAVSF